MSVVDFIMENQASFVAIFGGLMVIGGVIVKLTPTKVDDAWMEKIKGLASKFTSTK